MKKIFLFLLFLSCNLGISAQNENSISDYYEPEGPKLGIDAMYGINSNAITNSFTQGFYTAGFIERELKDRVSGKLDNENRLGGDINFGIYFSNSPDSLFGKAGISYYVGIRNREHLDVAFSRDFFNLGFYGNKRFAGETANLDGFNLNMLRYQQLEMGLIFNEGKWGAGLSLLKGEQFLSMDIPVASIYTATDGTYMDLNLAVNTSKSDTANKNLWAFNGTGVSTDFFAIFNLSSSDSSNRFFVEVKDLGFISWNHNSLNSSLDTNLHYEGYEIHNIFQLQDTVLAGTLNDSVWNAAYSREKKSNITVLPAFFHIAYIVDINEKLELTAGYKHRIMANYSFYSYLRGSYKLSPGFNIQAKIAYGGYGNLNFGLGFNKFFGPKFNLTLYSDNIEGYVLPKQTTGQGIFFGMEKTF